MGSATDNPPLCRFSPQASADNPSRQIAVRSSKHSKDPPSGADVTGAGGTLPKGQSLSLHCKVEGALPGGLF